MYMFDMPMSGGSFFMLIFWLLIFAVIFLLVLSLFRKFNSSSNNETELDILKKRYAKGEINAEQFKEMKRFLAEQ